MIIELIGAPGTGKTTVVQALLRARARGVRFSSTASFAMRPRWPRLSRWIPGIYAAHALRANRVSSFLLFRPVSNEERTQALADMAPRWEAFLNECLDTRPGAPRSPALRVMALQWLLETLQLRAWIERHARESDMVFMDEPLGGRLSLFENTPEGRAALRRYGEHMPLPDGAVHFVADACAVMERLEARRAWSGWVNHRHRELGPAEIMADVEWALTVGRTIASILEKRGVPVLSLDAGQPVRALAGEVRRFALQVREERGSVA